MKPKRNKNIDYTAAVVRSPCYGCEDRKVGCHSLCDRYKAYRGVQDSYREKSQDRKRKRIDYLEYTDSRFYRLKNYKKGKEGTNNK